MFVQHFLKKKKCARWFWGHVLAPVPGQFKGSNLVVYTLIGRVALSLSLSPIP